MSKEQDPHLTRSGTGENKSEQNVDSVRRARKPAAADKHSLSTQEMRAVSHRRRDAEEKLNRHLQASEEKAEEHDDGATAGTERPTDI